MKERAHIPGPHTVSLSVHTVPVLNETQIYMTLWSKTLDISYNNKQTTIKINTTINEVCPTRNKWLCQIRSFIYVYKP